MNGEAGDQFKAGAARKSDFFRDLAGSIYLRHAEEVSKSAGVGFDRLVGVYDKAILEVENHPPDAGNFGRFARAALEAMPGAPPELSRAVDRAVAVPLRRAASVGTGYGRATLPFPKEQIRSEILCHGLGAHSMFSGTRTVLDIGGQDTKAIQVDAQGIVTSFQMNDRCAAGCGRYLGYIADEMNLGVQELGPMACTSSRPVRINSTCTVFAGAELEGAPLPGGEAGGHPGRPPPGHHPPGHVSPGPLGRGRRSVHLHGRRGQEPGRREGAAGAHSGELRRARP